MTQDIRIEGEETRDPSYRLEIRSSERTDLLRALHGPDLCSVVWDWLEWARTEIKHHGAGAETERAREIMCELLTEAGLDIERLWE